MTKTSETLITETFKVREGHFLTVSGVPATLDPQTGEASLSMGVMRAIDALKRQADAQGLTELQFDAALIPIHSAPDPVSRELRRAMLARGMTGAAIARALGVKPPLVSRWLSSSYHDHSMETLRRIAEVLDMDVEVTLKPRAS